MSQNITFSLANTLCPAGTMKIQVTVDMTGFPSLTGSDFTMTAGVFSCTGGAFQTELEVGAKIYVDFVGTEYTFSVLTITDDDNCTIDDATTTGLFTQEAKAIVYPTSNLIISMDEQTEKVDVETGLYEYDNFKLEMADDYSFYNSGFWYYLFRYASGYVVKFFILFDEGATDSFITFGNVNSTSVEFKEVALKSNLALANSKIRTVGFEIISGLDLLKNLTTQDLVDYITTSREVVGTAFIYPAGTIVSGDFVLLTDVIASMMKLLYDQTFDAGFCQVRGDDIIFRAIQDGGVSADITFSDLYMWGYNGTTTSFLDPTAGSNDCWIKYYPTAFDLLKAICANFGFVPRYYLGQTNGTYAGDGSDRHRIELLCRGRSGATLTMSGDIISSINKPNSPNTIQTARCSDRIFSEVVDFFYNSSNNPTTTAISEIFRITTPDPDPYLLSQQQFDFDLISDFSAYNTLTYSTALGRSALYYDVLTGGNAGGFVYGGSFWNYKTGAYEDFFVGSPADVTIFPIALARYYYYKFKGQAQYIREYSDVRSNDGTTTSQRNTSCLQGIEITDDFETRTFYAIEVKKSYTKNKAQITWFEE